MFFWCILLKIDKRNSAYADCWRNDCVEIPPGILTFRYSGIPPQIDNHGLDPFKIVMNFKFPNLENNSAKDS